MEPGRALATFVAETPFEAIPSEVVESIRIAILDDLACGFAGAPHAWSRTIAETLTADGQCSMFGRSSGGSASLAALYNGVCVGGFETDHVYSPGSAHPGGAVFPAALAAAEVGQASGGQFFAAIALGYEALCRVGAAATRAVEEERGFHGPATNAALGAAFGAARVLGLSVDDTLSAAGIAASHGGGLLEFSRDGAETKRLHVGRGSQMGLESVLLAQRGFVGPTSAIEGEHGFLRTFSPSPRPDLLTKDLGERWLSTELSLKAFPCHVTFHPVVDAIRRWRAGLGGGEAPRIERVRIQSVHRMTSDRFHEPSPQTLLGAQISLEWGTALSLLHDPAAPDSWGEATLDDASVRRLAALVEVTRAAPVAPGAVADVVVTTDAGEVSLAATDWDGAPTRPYTFEMMARKFHAYASGQISESRIDEVVGRVARLEHESDASALSRLIRTE